MHNDNSALLGQRLSPPCGLLICLSDTLLSSLLFLATDSIEAKEKAAKELESLGYTVDENWVVSDAPTAPADNTRSRTSTSSSDEAHEHRGGQWLPLLVLSVVFLS